MKFKFWPLIIFCLAIAAAWPAAAQQKGQYMPGQYGLNAGILPSPGFTYANLDINYDTSTINDANGNAINPKPNLNLWVIENIFYYVSDATVLGENLGFILGARERQRKHLWTRGYVGATVHLRDGI